MNKLELIQGFIAYLEAAGELPYIVINVQNEQKIPGLPEKLHEGDHTVLNLSSQACGLVAYMDDRIVAEMTFGGVQAEVEIPLHTIECVYAPRNGGQRLIFGPGHPPPQAKSESKPKPKLRIVK